MTSLRHPAIAAVLTASALIGAGCGSSSHKIKDSGFISKCQSEIKGSIDANAKALGAKADQLRGYVSPICNCVQHRLVAIGYGDKDYNDKSLDNDPKANGAIAACAKQQGVPGL